MFFLVLYNSKCGDIIVKFITDIKQGAKERADRLKAAALAKVANTRSRTVKAAADTSRRLHERIGEDWGDSKKQPYLVGLAISSTLSFLGFTGLFVWFTLGALEVFFASLGWSSLFWLCGAAVTGTVSLYLWAVIANRPKIIFWHKPKEAAELPAEGNGQE